MRSVPEKTYEMVVAARESKRSGLCTKSLIVLPNHITGQWASEWLQLYPSANILVADEKDFFQTLIVKSSRQNRRLRRSNSLVIVSLKNTDFC